jgi:hypothetical protein
MHIYDREAKDSRKNEPTAIKTSGPPIEMHETLKVSINELTIDELSTGNTSVFSDDVFYIDGYTSEV